MNQKDDEIFQLELKIKVLTTKLDQQETTKQKNMLVQDQFIAWEQQGKQLARCHKTINQLKDKVEFGETTIASLTEQIEELQNKNRYFTIAILGNRNTNSHSRIVYSIASWMKVAIEWRILKSTKKIFRAKYCN